MEEWWIEIIQYFGGRGIYIILWLEGDQANQIAKESLGVLVEEGDWIGSVPREYKRRKRSEGLKASPASVEYDDDRIEDFSGRWRRAWVFKPVHLCPGRDGLRNVR